MQQYPLQSPIKDHQTPPLDSKPLSNLPNTARSPVSSSHVSNGYNGPSMLTSESPLPATSSISNPLHAPSVSAPVAQDAEGSPDPEFAEGAAADNARPDDGASTPTSSSQSPRPGKRKVREDEEDYINNPELYGLRRSVRIAYPAHEMPLTSAGPSP